MSSSNCCFLTCIQVSQEAGQVVWYPHISKNFSQFVVIHTVKGFGIVNKAEIDVFFWNSLAFSMIQWTLAVWSLVLTFLKPAWTSGSSRFTYYWSLARRILSIILPACEMSAIVQQFEHSLALPFIVTGMKLTFSSPVDTAEFSRFAGILSAAFSQDHLLGFGIAQLEFYHLH